VFFEGSGGRAVSGLLFYVVDTFSGFADPSGVVLVVLP
jgi:hypothetical protein